MEYNQIIQYNTTNEKIQRITGQCNFNSQNKSSTFYKTTKIICKSLTFIFMLVILT